MEYKRHRRRGASRRNKRDNGQAARALLAICMAAAIVYLVSASAAGTWLAEEVVVPVFAAIDRFKSLKPEAEETPAPEALADTAQVALDTSRKAIEADMTLPAVTCFAVQMGVFASDENAQAQSALLQKMGGGGYVLEDAGRYRVIAAGYETEAEARSVKDRLTAQGVDCALYTLSTDAATYRVSAQEEQLGDVEKGFAALANAQRALTAAVRAFDKEGAAAADGKAALSRIADTLKSDMALLSGYAGEQAALSSLLSCYADTLAAIEEAASSSAVEASAFAAELKHVQLYATDRYAAFMRALSGQNAQ